MKRIFLLAFVFTFLTPCLAQKVKNETLKLSESDKTKIILSVLNRTAFGQPNLQVSEQSDTAYISTENLPHSFVEKFQRIKGIKIRYVQPEGLEERARNNFDYLEFSEFEIRRGGVLVSLFYAYADTNTSSLSYEFRKVKGKWKGKLKGWTAAAG